MSAAGDLDLAGTEDAGVSKGIYVRQKYLLATQIVFDTAKR